MKHIPVFAFAAAALALIATPLAPTSASPSPAPLSDQIPVGLLVDLSTGQTLFAREPDRMFMPASVTKVMTAYSAFKLIDEGKLRLDMPFLYTEELEDEWYGKGSNMYLRAGERPTIAQLLLGITTVSGNDAAEAMAIAATGSLDSWLALMNRNAVELGMRNTHFGSPNGFPDRGMTYTTARDLAVLGEAITQRYPGLYRRFFGHQRLTWRGITQPNHDPLTGKVEGADGMKTGYTNEAGYTFLGSGERNGRRLVMVIAGSPSPQARNESARALLEWGFEEFEQRTVLPGSLVVGSALVQDGAQDRVELRTPDNVVAALPRGEEGEVTMEVVYRGPAVAPIAEGDRIARLRVSLDGELALEVPLEAVTEVPRANPLQRIANAFGRWFG